MSGCRIWQQTPTSAASDPWQVPRCGSGPQLDTPGRPLRALAQPCWRPPAGPCARQHTPTSDSWRDPGHFETPPPASPSGSPGVAVDSRALAGGVYHRRTRVARWDLPAAAPGGLPGSRGGGRGATAPRGPLLSGSSQQWVSAAAPGGPTALAGVCTWLCPWASCCSRGGGSTAMTGGPPGLTGGFHCPTLGPVRA